ITYRNPLDLFTYPEHYHEDIESVYIPHGVIMNRIERLASHIMDDFGNNNIMVLCVLKGGYKFCSDLVEFIKVLGRNSGKYLETRVEFIRLKSYLVGLPSPVSSGLCFVLCLLHRRTVQGNLSIFFGTLIIYALFLPCPFVLTDVGFEIPNRFVVGYALDYNEYFRDLNHICVISRTGKMKYKV
uniref:Un-named sa821 n=1 Tax=Salarias fasciatus TaxID=181472 RepID=A0A672GMZ0_SALFA